MAPTRSHLLQHARTTAIRSSAHATLLGPHPAWPYPIPAPVPIIPGVLLASELPKPDYSDPRGSVRLLLTKLLILATGDPCARMWWNLTKFQKEIVLRYGLLLYGWPADIVFTNLSPGNGSPSMAQVRQLLSLLAAEPQPQMFFLRATPEQLHAARLDVAAAAPGPLFPAPVPLPYVGRSDIGRRRGGRARYSADGSIISPRYIRDGPKSAKVISEELDSEPSGWALVTGGPYPQMHKDGVWLIWGESGWRLPMNSELLGRSNIGWAAR